MLNSAIIGGLMLAVWPLAQTVYAHWNQNQLEQQWKEQTADSARTKSAKKVAAKSGTGAPRTGAPQTGAPQKVTVSDDPTMKAAPSKARPQKWALTKLSIPDIGLETYAVQGWDEAALRRGPGHDPNSALPGVGNCVLAGHRNIYGSYFYQLDQLVPCAPIVLQNRDGRFTYTTGRVFTTTDTDYGIMAQPAPGAVPILTLITCTMPHTSNRIVVQATLSSLD